MSATSQILREARKLIEAPENWTQGEYARGVDGSGTVPYDRGAVCFCSVGAISKVANVDPVVQCIPRDAVGFLGFEHEADLIRFNDRSSHEEVLGRLSRAITAAEEAGR